MPRKAGGLSIAAALRAYDAEIYTARIVARFLADGEYRLACSTVRLSRYRTQITPPGGGEPIIWNRRPKTVDSRPIGRPRKVREVADVAPERLIVGLAGLAKGLMDNRGISPPAAAQYAVKNLVWQRRLDVAERDAVVTQVLRVMRQLGYRRRR